MADAQKIEPCDVCSGAGELDQFCITTGVHASAACQMRFRVRCTNPACGHMTPHFGAACLALAVWNERTGHREDKLAG
jgi:hypothetical protein